MVYAAFNFIFTALLVSFAAWLAGKRPVLAGFIVALPLTTMLVLPLSYLQYSDPANSVKFAKSIFIAIPVSLLFFLPFLCAEKLKLQFWQSYIFGVVLLCAGYFIHKFIFRAI